MSTNPSELSLPQKVIQHVTVTHTALEKAAAAEAVHRAKSAEVDALIPSACDTLIEHECIKPTEREKLAALLHDPAKALEVLIKVAERKAQADPSRLGAGVDPRTQEKRAGARQQYDSLADPRVGMRTTLIKQSDDKFYRGLGLEPPTSV